MADLKIEVPKEVTQVVYQFCSLSKSAREGKSTTAAQANYHIGMFCAKLFEEEHSKEVIEKLVEQLFLDGGLLMAEVTPIVNALMRSIMHDRKIAVWQENHRDLHPLSPWNKGYDPSRDQ